MTPDIDALTDGTAVRVEAMAMAEEYGLPSTWINASAQPFVPPRPEAAASNRLHPG